MSVKIARRNGKSGAAAEPIMGGYINTAKTVEWETPQDLFDKLNEEFHFTVDVCASEQNAKCERFYTRETDGLRRSWSGETAWCNPPYGREIAEWVKKASTEDATTVMLLPARTDAKWFHEHCYNKVEIRFLKGRLKFGGMKTNAPFPSMIVVFRKAARQQ